MVVDSKEVRKFVAELICAMLLVFGPVIVYWLGGGNFERDYYLGTTVFLTICFLMISSSMLIKYGIKDGGEVEGED